MLDIEELIYGYAKQQRIKKKDYPAFRLKLLASLKKYNIDTKSIDIEKYKKMAREGIQ